MVCLLPLRAMFGYESGSLRFLGIFNFNYFIWFNCMLSTYNAALPLPFKNKDIKTRWYFLTFSDCFQQLPNDIYLHALTVEFWFH